MRIVCLSDTHGRHRGLDVPDGDLLIHAGDLTAVGEPVQVQEAADWLAALPHRHKVVIAGNHDFLFEREPEEARRALRDVTYLQDEGVELDGLRIWGSPWQPWFNDWAFNLRRGQPLRERWSLIPTDTQVLVTHGPPRGHGDRTVDGRAVGCLDLLGTVRRIRPRLHVFGHIHEGYGTTHEGPTTFVNASICDVDYRPGNEPIVVDTASWQEAPYHA